MADVRLTLGDCLDVLREMESGSVDAVVTDPPYNVGCAYKTHNDRMTPEDYEAWCRRWHTECRRIARQCVIFPGHGNLAMWHRIERPSGIGCWYKPGNPARGGVFQFCEWEPFILYGGTASKSDVIRATVTKQRGVGDHPCPKPLSLMMELLSRLPKAKTILDPFAGSGTTLVAAIETGRNAIGIEISPEYHAIAEKRIAAARAALPLFAE